MDNVVEIKRAERMVVRHRCRPVRLWFALIAASLLILPLAAHGPASVSAAGSAATATKLVAALEQAKTQDQRVQALEAIFRAIGLGVRSSNLGIVVPGGEKSASDVYLYTDELDEMATAFGNNDLVSFDQLGLSLGAAGLTAPPPYPYAPTPFLTGQQIQQVVQGGEKKWVTGKGNAALYAQILRDLGLARHVDLEKLVPAKSPNLDAVQQALITLGAVANAKPMSTASSGARRVQRLTNGFVRYTPAARKAGPCDFKNANTDASGYGAAKIVLSLFGKAGAVVATVTAATDVFHATIIEVSLSVTSKSPDPVKGEFGQNGPHSAKHMLFKVLVKNEAPDPPESVIKCGALGGYTFPKHGPVPNIKVEFLTQGLKVLGYPITDFGQEGNESQTTGPKGIAIFPFQPATEYLPDTGPVRGTVGHIVASALPLSSTGSALGVVTEFAGLTKDAIFTWDMLWHQPGGYEIDLPGFTVTEFDAQGTQNATSETYKLAFKKMAICIGKDPLTGEQRNAGYPVNPLEPQAVAPLYYPAFGAGKNAAEPDNGYATGTATYKSPNGTSTSSVDAHYIYMPWNTAGLPYSWAGFAGISGGDSSLVSSASISTRLVWDAGHAGEDVTLQFNPKSWQKGAKVAPDHFSWTVPWKQATNCPMPPPVS